ncbi:hypothetical protein BDA96_03G014800 [Sorghum bicolor]|uniref:Uncharacterized protein n=2 Tax=Sorghum bicolor TaxID=4558 RepID=A0A921R9Y0_SORBI|nr:hypothetical protein BDA96_03G014800 [Sorghum bicolor]KXG31532.1 hypothetical protein SORBI_3003G013300 [Sorghum bicolor]
MTTMVEEALAACTEATNRPLSFSPPGSPLADELRSPIYTPSNWDKLAELNEEARALGCQNVIHFGPGIQQEVDGQVITAGITEQVAEMMLEERRNNIVNSIFVPCEQPLLQTPIQKQQDKVEKAKAPRTTVGGLPRSSRQKAKVCSVPVSRRATHRLIKAFEVKGPNEPIGEQALEAFAKTFSTPLTPQQIAAVRSLTSLDSGAVMAASAQLAAAEGADTMGDAAL